MPLVDLLRSLPRTKRDVCKRATTKTPEIVATAKKFGQEYFDGSRDVGYGGYRYDGRWQPVAKDIIRHFNLKAGQRVLDVGAAKGFLVKDLMAACPGLEVFGLDISDYAIRHSEPEASGKLVLGTCEQLPFRDDSFAAVLSINTLHNCHRAGVIRSLREIQRLCGGRAFVQVDAYRSEEERQVFLDWVLTAEFHGYPSDWQSVFSEAGYTGDYGWTLV